MAWGLIYGFIDIHIFGHNNQISKVVRKIAALHRVGARME
jgi:hypothetical protein